MKKMLDDDGGSFEQDALSRLGSYMPDDVIDVVDRGLDRGASYHDLYLRWERQNWRTEELDFSRDADDWQEQLTEPQRRQLMWFFAQFFHGEERVAMELTPFIDAAPSTDQQIFLTTQVVDEARHAQFFDKFYREALGFDQDTMEERMQSVRSLLSAGFEELFGPILNGVATKMRRGDHSLETFIRGVVTYHLIIEGTVALTGQRYVLEFFRKNDMMPGFRNGFTAVARDESRHVNFGVKFLRDCVVEDPETVGVIHDQLAVAMPAAARIFDPPAGEQGPGQLLGFTMGELYTYGFKTLTKRLRAIGAPAPFRWRQEVTPRPA